MYNIKKVLCKNTVSILIFWQGWAILGYKDKGLTFIYVYIWIHVVCVNENVYCE